MFSASNATCLWRAGALRWVPQRHTGNRLHSWADVPALQTVLKAAEYRRKHVVSSIVFRSQSCLSYTNVT